MKAKIRVFVGLAAIVLALTGTAMSFMPRQKAEEDAETAAVETVGYVLREYAGCVAVYRTGEENLPEQVTDIEVRLLPEADRAQLKSGIYVQSEQELIMLLEDLNS